MLSNCIPSFARFFGKLPIRPLGPRVVIELDKKKEEVNGILLPTTVQQQINQGKVLAVGPGRKVDDKLLPITLKVGQRVLIPQYGGQVVKLGKEEYTIIDEEAVLGVFD